MWPKAAAVGCDNSVFNYRMSVSAVAIAVTWCGSASCVAGVTYKPTTDAEALGVTGSFVCMRGGETRAHQSD